MGDDYELGGFHQVKNVSYLRARDPTLHWNYDRSNVKINLQKDVLEFENNITRANQNDNNIQVHLRIKRVSSTDDIYEIRNESSLLCKVPESAQSVRKVRDGNSVIKSYTFSKIFGPEATQEDLFNNVVKENVLKFINGLNCSLLTYGASGSGKTFTIVGTTEKPGIIPRALEYLFRTLPQLSEEPEIKPNVYGGVIRLNKFQSKREMVLKETLLKGLNDCVKHTRTYRAMQQRLSQEPVASLIDGIENVNLSIWVSFAEIYNENIYDLLRPTPKRGSLRPKLRLGRANTSTYIKDLTCIQVSSGLEAYQILQYGLQNLNYAVTSLNNHSSRSHSIFTIKLAQASDNQNGVGVNLFNFCDLAGSERLKKTNNVGDRLKESTNINTSLLVLGRCISLIRDSQKNNDKTLIPFRESKLTQLFQNALVGQEAISMIVNISPAKEMFDETQHALNFSAIAKELTIEQQVIKGLKQNRFSGYVDSVTDDGEIEELHEKLSTIRSQIEQFKIDTEVNNEHIMKSYKEILERSDIHGKERYQKLVEKSTQTVRETPEHASKKRKMSVIILDTSIDGNDENKYLLNCHDTSQNIQHQDNLIRLEIETKSIDDEINEVSLQNKLLEKTLQDAKTSYLSLKMKYQSETKELSLELLKKQEVTKELSLNIATLDNIFENKENSNPSGDVNYNHENDSLYKEVVMNPENFSY